MNSALENIYTTHHNTQRGHFFTIEGKMRGSFLRSKIGKGKKVADIGCRDGALTAEYFEGNFVTGIDIDRDALVRVKNKLSIETLYVDLNGEWGLPEHSFDVVVACEIIEHLYHPDSVVKKAKLLLKSGGCLVGSVPLAFSLQNRIRLLLGTKKGTPLSDPTHINQFFFVEFKNILKDNFSNVEVIAATSQKYFFIPKFLKRYFAHTILFYASDKK